jgi:Tol biopolymer transport system component
MVKPDGTNHKWLTPAESDAYFPQWCPTGRRIYFTMDSDLCVMTLADEKIVPIVESRGGNLWLEDISPSGRWIAFSAEVFAFEGVKQRIFLHDLKTGKMVDLQANLEKKREPSSARAFKVKAKRKNIRS